MMIFLGLIVRDEEKRVRTRSGGCITRSSVRCHLLGVWINRSEIVGRLRAEEAETFANRWS